jgi:hypothetical protein
MTPGPSWPLPTVRTFVGIVTPAVPLAERKERSVPLIIGAFNEGSCVPTFAHSRPQVSGPVAALVRAAWRTLWAT